MIAQIIFAVMPSLALGFTSPHREEAFLGVAHKHHSTPDEEMSANMHFEPLSTTMKCVIGLTLQYIIVYTALGISRSYCDFQGVSHDKSLVQRALKSAAETVFFAPMACLLFIGFRMRVLQLTQGQGNPQGWARMCMEFVSWSILANTLIAIIIPVFTETEVEIDHETGEVKTDSANPFSNQIMAVLFTVLRYLTFLGLYVGFGGVLVGIYLFEPPKELWEGEIPDISPAVACTMTLSCAFFMVYLGMAIARSYTQFVAGSTGKTQFEKVMSMAATTMDLAPMLCVLFLGARMRALQMDPKHGNPQRWAQNCFFLCTYSIIVQTCVAVFVPLILGGEVKQGRAAGDVVVEKVDMLGGYLAKGLSVLRFLVMLGVYAGALAVVCAVFTMEHPDGKEHTIPVSPTMQCVVNLAFQYFFIYILLWIFITVEDFTDMDLEFVRDAIETAKSTVQFAPMLCVLFIATRMRALQITDNKGAPQGWAQDGMYMASWSLLVQFLMCLIMPIFTGKTYTTDSLDGSKTADKEPISNPIGAWIVTITRYLALIGLYAGVILVVCGALMMTPETANGRGSVPLLGEMEDATGVDLVPGAPPSVKDLPGAETAMKETGKTVGAGADMATETGDAVAGAGEAVASPVTGF
jgi:hypothetical protein